MSLESEPRRVTLACLGRRTLDNARRRQGRVEVTCPGCDAVAKPRRSRSDPSESRVNDTLGTTTRYWYDGVNEIVESDENDARQRYFVHGVSYVDERLMLFVEGATDGDDRPYYYAIDRMYP